MSFTEYTKYDGLGLAELVRNGEIKPSELVEAATTRIEKHNSALNAVVHKAYDLGEAAARMAEQSPSDAPFSGVPFLLKDIGAMCEGLPKQMGSKFLQGFIAPMDSELARRYKQSGACILGTTNAPEFGLVPTTESQLYGKCHNPWNLQHSTGGSSGGSAAAVAAGIVPLAHANDGGGSIRIPAACCGLVGMKPTRARITDGPLSGELLGGLVNDHVVSRSVRDSAAMLDATAGPMPGDPYVAPPPRGTFLDAAMREPGQLRVAVCATQFDGTAIHPEVSEATRKTAATLASLGHVVTEDTIAEIPTITADAFVTIWSVGAATGLDGFGQLLGKQVQKDDVESITWMLYERGKNTSASEYIAAWDSIYGLGRTIGQFFERYDVWLTPTLAQPPAKLGDIDTMREDAYDAFMELINYVPFTPVFNATGQPSISLPLHQSADGLPLGMMLTGRYGDEETLYSMAGQLEQALPWRDRTPLVWD